GGRRYRIVPCQSTFARYFRRSNLRGRGLSHLRRLKPRIESFSLRFLRISPVINDRDFLNAANGTMGRARLFCEILALNVGERVLLEGSSGIAALLGTVVHEAVFTNVQIACAGAASPSVWFAGCEIFLEPIKPSGKV